MIGQNGLMRCYNMFPSNFRNISEMTDYLPKLQALGMNVVWINPIQLAGETIIEKNDPLTGENQKLKGSLYAMADSTLIDPRFSVVNRDEDGDMVLSQEQILQVRHLALNPVETRVLKAKRHELNELEEKVKKRELEVSRTKRNIDKRREQSKNTAGLEQQLIGVSRKLELEKAQLAQCQSEFDALHNTHIDCIRELDKSAIKKFTAKAKELGIVPIFDLVFNHLANDADWIQKHPDLFNESDRTFPDATAFLYSKLLGSKHSKPLEEREKREALDKISTIIEQYWRPFLNKYITEYGFSGVRVDCVRKVPYELRKPVYEILEGLVQQADQSAPVILEETLFSDLSPKEYVEMVKGAGATHNTGSVYYKERQWHGGLPEDYSNEDFHKRSVVQNGVINFTGNHDHFTCGMTVCRELAFERLKENKSLYGLYLDELKQKEGQYSARNESVPDTVQDILKTTYMHFYINQIINELNKPEQYNETLVRFGKAYRDKFLTNVLAGSGGYYMLSGDEFASFYQPSVFIRANGQPVVPDKEMAIFNSEHAHVAEQILDDMADAALRRRQNAGIYTALGESDQAILRSPLKAQYKNEVNTGIEPTKKRFLRVLGQKVNQLDPSLLNYQDIPDGPGNGWGAPAALKSFVPNTFFAELNNIVGKLPPSKEGYWSELFKARNEDLLIAVRMNGYGYKGKADVVVYNLNPYKKIEIEKEDIHKIANWFRQRGFPNPKQEDFNNPDYKRAYNCIMGSAETNQPPANLYFGGQIELKPDLVEHQVMMNGRAHRFNLVVAPHRPIADLLLTRSTDKLIKETAVPAEILRMIENLKLKDETSKPQLVEQRTVEEQSNETSSKKKPPKKI